MKLLQGEDSWNEVTTKKSTKGKKVTDSSANAASTENVAATATPAVTNLSSDDVKALEVMLAQVEALKRNITHALGSSRGDDAGSDPNAQGC
ncbi:hypothetical protein PG994_013485 [Apiospora phragmitis]|uniref:Transposase n=1 Tax=Apiospora phragmitis TaxID=2905665 RepID=A0ABR1T8S5_9PEZI